MSERLFCPCCESELSRSGTELCCELGGTEYCQWDGHDNPLTERRVLERERQRVKNTIAAEKTKLLKINAQINQL